MNRALGQVLELVRAWEPAYRRWWSHPRRRESGGLAPWSDADEERWRSLLGFDAERMAAVAHELRWVSTELAAHRTGIAEVVTAGGMPEPAAHRCASVADAVAASAADAASLADAIERAAARIGTVLDAVVDGVLRAAEALDAGPYPTPGLAHRDIDAAGAADEAPHDPDRWRALDELVERHSGVLAALRAGMTEPSPHGNAGPDVWCDGDTGCLPRPSPWLSVPLPPPAEDVGVWVSEPWRPLPAAPGTGPLLPGTDGIRPGTDRGVHVAQLPDRPF